MTSSQWVHLIKQEFNVSSTMAKKMYHEMIVYYKLHKDWSGKNDR